MTRWMQLAGLALAVTACSSSESSRVGTAGTAGAGGDDSGAGGAGGATFDGGADGGSAGGDEDGGASDTFAGCSVGFYVPCGAAVDCNNWQYWCTSGKTYNTGRGCTNGACDIASIAAEAHCADAGGVAGYKVTEEADGGERCVSCDVPGCKPKGGTCAKASDCCSCRCESGKCAL